MTDALDNIARCPGCEGIIFMTIEGLYCPRCNYLYCQEEGESIIETAERFNADRDEIAREMRGGEGS